MTIQIPTADIQATFNAAIQNALASESMLGANAKAQTQQLVSAMYPSLISMTQESLKSTNPAVQQGYLAILEGVVAAKTAELSLSALETQRQIVASALSTAISILGMVLKAAVVAA